MKSIVRYHCKKQQPMSFLGNEETLQLDEDGKIMPLTSHARFGGIVCPFDYKCETCEFAEKYTLTEWPDVYEPETAAVDKNGDYELCRYSEDYMVEKQSDFHVGGFDDGEPAKKIYCKKCGGDKFELGRGDGKTIIRCPVCKWEYAEDNG